MDFLAKTWCSSVLFIFLCVSCEIWRVSGNHCNLLKWLCILLKRSWNEHCSVKCVHTREPNCLCQNTALILFHATPYINTHIVCDKLVSIFSISCSSTSDDTGTWDWWKLVVMHFFYLAEHFNSLPFTSAPWNIFYVNTYLL